MVGKWGKGAWLPRQLPEVLAKGSGSHTWGRGDGVLSWRSPGSFAREEALPGPLLAFRVGHRRSELKGLSE